MKKGASLLIFSGMYYLLITYFDYACREIIFKCFFEMSTFEEDVISALFSTGDDV